jgi:hypothetical protein
MKAKPENCFKKPYSKPSLKVYGGIQAITATVRTVTNAADNSGVGGANKTQ